MFFFPLQYLNSGAGGVGGFFVHSNHHSNSLKRLTGWWSNKQETRCVTADRLSSQKFLSKNNSFLKRFQMAEKVDLAEGAEGFRLANPSPWHAALNMASLEVIHVYIVS